VRTVPCQTSVHRGRGWALRNRARQGSEEQPTTWSIFTEGTTIALNTDIELRQVLKNTTARSITGNFGKRYAMLEENPDGQTFRAFKHSLTTQWDVLSQVQSMVKEYYEVKESQKGQFKGVRRNYHVWRRRVLYIVHSQPPEESGSRSAIGWIKERWPLESIKNIHNC
jgi:hypothetical protein